MTLIQGCRRPCREHLSVASSIATSDSSPPPKSEFFEQPIGPLGMKLLIAVATIATTNILKYFEDDLQKIFKTVLEAQASVSAPALIPAPAVSKMPQNELKTGSPDIYCGKSYMDNYNFC